MDPAPMSGLPNATAEHPHFPKGIESGRGMMYWFELYPLHRRRGVQQDLEHRKDAMRARALEKRYLAQRSAVPKDTEEERDSGD